MGIPNGEENLRVNDQNQFHIPFLLPLIVRIMYIMLNEPHVDTPDLSLPRSFSSFCLLCIKHNSIYHKVYNYHIGSCLHIEQYGNY